MAQRKRRFAASVFSVVTTYVGTVVGAGFASGQEALRFFGAYGKFGLAGVAIATILFCIYGIWVMDLGRRIHAYSHQEILLHACGPYIGPLMDGLVTLFLGATLTVMLAGGGAIFVEQVGLPQSIGVIITACLSALTILVGMRGVMTANSIVVPLLTLAVVTLTAASIHFHGLEPILMGTLPWPVLAPVKSWFLSAWLYVGYNLVLSIAVLGPLGAELKDRRALVVGGILGGVLLGMLIASIVLAVSVHMPGIGRFEIPMLFLARLHPRPVQWLYTLILWAEIYTTAISCAYGVTTRVSKIAGGRYREIVLLVMVVALLGSRFGFGTLMSTLYPLFGLTTLIVLLCLAVVMMRHMA